jgi:hypothetical protein
MHNKFTAICQMIFLTLFLSVSFTTSSFAADKPHHTSGKVFIFDPPRLQWAVYDNGKLVRSGHAVGGKRNCADIHRPCLTPSGTFRIHSKQGPNFRSSIYPLPHGGASMPYAMFFHGGYAIHGSNEVPNHPASHGCIRVYPSDARWLSHYLPVGTKVVVKHS